MHGQVPHDKVVLYLPKWTAGLEDDEFGERSTFLNVKLVANEHDATHHVMDKWISGFGWFMMLNTM